MDSHFSFSLFHISRESNRSWTYEHVVLPLPFPTVSTQLTFYPLPQLTFSHKNFPLATDSLNCWDSERQGTKLLCLIPTESFLSLNGGNRNSNLNWSSADAMIYYFLVLHGLSFFFIPWRVKLSKIEVDCQALLKVCKPYMKWKASVISYSKVRTKQLKTVKND